MTYPYMGNNGDLNYCYLYLQELQRCAQNKHYPQTRCQNQMQDFKQCHTRQRHRSAFQKASEAMSKAVNINVPHYDFDHDSFIFDDGTVISNTDPIFNQYKWF